MSQKISLGWITLFIMALLSTGAMGSEQDPEADFDRLDGSGRSGKTVNVIEWEGNLEIHVYPQGSLASLDLKMDKRDENKPVMVIGYHFNGDSDALIRRAILGIPLYDGFKAYRDASAKGYDKIIISNQKPGGKVTSYTFNPNPKQLYPDEHPAMKKPEREPASQKPNFGLVPKNNQLPVAQPPRQSDDEQSGTVTHFSW